MKEPRTLGEMASDAGRGLVCPECNCTNFATYKTRPGYAVTFRYKQCRNCGHRILTTQPGERLVRDVAVRDPDDEDDSAVILSTAGQRQA